VLIPIPLSSLDELGVLNYPNTVRLVLRRANVISGDWPKGSLPH